MKRSDFIDDLYFKMNDRLVGKRINDKQFIEEMLDIIEEAGMLPPITTKIEKSIPEVSTGIYKSNEWEDEDGN